MPFTNEGFDLDYEIWHWDR